MFDEEPTESLIASVPSAIDLRQLRYFLAVSEELHFGRAAKRLHLAQPPLSRAVRRLEDELGVRLLDRTSAVALTDAGRAFAEEARKVLLAAHVAVEEARRAGGAGTTLRLGCVPALPVDRLLEYVEVLREREPSMSIQVAHLFTLEQVRRLRSGDLDVGIVFDPGDHAELEKEPLFAGEALAAFFRADHRLAGSRVIGPADVRDETLVTGPRAANPAVYEQVLSGFAEAGYRFRNVEEAGGATWRDIFVAVASGQGIAFAPVSRENGSRAGVKVVRRELDPPLQMPTIFVAWRRDASPGRRPVFETVHHAARELWASSSLVKSAHEASAARPS